MVVSHFAHLIRISGDYHQQSGSATNAHRARSRKLVISELYYWFYRHVIPFYYRLTIGSKNLEESAPKVASLMKRKHPKMSQIHGQIDPGEELVTEK